MDRPHTDPPTVADPAADAALADLVRRAADGSADAWRLLADRYARRLFALAFAHLRSESLAEDIAQSVFVTLAEQLAAGAYTEQHRFEPWLFRIAMNRVRDEARRRKNTPADLASAPPPAAPNSAPQAALERHEHLDKLRDALTHLAPDEQSLIAMRHHAAMSFKDIAETLDQPLGTVLARHHRALRKLRLLLEPQDPRPKDHTS